MTLPLADELLAAGLVLVAIGALWARERTTRLGLFLGFGLLMTGAWLRLGAPDVALAEAALAGGVTGALLVRVVSAAESRDD